MINHTNLNHDKPLPSRRFRHVVLFTICMVLLAIFSTIFVDDSVNVISFLTLDVLIMCSLFPLIKRDKLDFSKQLYLWSNLLVLSFIFWDRGGLLSSAVILVFPIFLMVSALLVGPKTFFSVYLFVVSFIVTISVLAINTHTSFDFHKFGYWDLSIVIILLTASGFTAWRFNDDMRYALRKLKIEVANVNQSRSEIERLIHYDPLTGLSSRLDCEEKFSLLKTKVSDNSNQIYFLFLDIDNFKSINDYHNHSTGDEVLKEISNRLLGLIQDSDVACRLSGDEFLLILTRSKDYNIEQLSKRILRKVAQPAEIFENNIEITASLGIALYNDKSDESFESVLKRADLAMYRAKELGKNKCSFYDEELSAKALRDIRIVRGLKSALKNNDLELFLQPKIDIVSGKVKSSEALLRWVRNNPENFSPAEFIPLIESTELICTVGEWVIKRACVLCKELHDKGFDDLSISVNISSAQFVMGNLENIIIRELQESQLDPQYLELELTERILFQDDDGVLDELSRIKELGVILSIDDFGTGYSNLGYLTKFKVDTLKIDQSFIRDINKSPQNLAIVDAIIKMAKALGLSIVAEGVETSQEWDILKQLNCDQGQGYLWSRPLTSNDFLAHVTEAV